jgi:hypothetical protein
MTRNFHVKPRESDDDFRDGMTLAVVIIGLPACSILSVAAVVLWWLA